MYVSLAVTGMMWLSLLPIAAGPAGAMPILPGLPRSQSDFCHRGEITIHPAAPTSADVVSAAVSGWWGSSCPAVTYEHSVAGCSVHFSITVTDMSLTEPIACLDVVTPWAITAVLGTLLPGTYAVQADVSGGSCWSFQRKASFHVRALAATYRQYIPCIVCTR